MRVTQAPGCAGAERASLNPLGRAPSDRVQAPRAAVLPGSGRGCWGEWQNLCRRRRQSCKAIAKQFAARSVPRAAATASAPLRPQGRGEVTEFTSPPLPLLE